MMNFKDCITVINFDTKPENQRYVAMFPNILRCGIFGPSGGDKSNLLLTILMYIKEFRAIYLCSKTAFKDKYKILHELIDSYNKNKTKQKIKFVTLIPNNLLQVSNKWMRLKNCLGELLKSLKRGK